MKQNYQMTTVYEYARLLDKDLTLEEKSVKNAIDRYLGKIQRARSNAALLEQLLA